jgi:N6-L-threonylcarbamoyladenine synthase
MKKNYLILAIDTSCDETSVAVTEDDRVLSNIVSSQIKYHQQYGGVVPYLAQKMHRQLLKPGTTQALKRAGKKITQVDAIAVTVGPGLAPALEVGLDFAKKLAAKTCPPAGGLIAVNHMEAHLLSAFANNSLGRGAAPTHFPVLGLLVSGGHTQLVLTKGFGDYQLLGETVDDAAGEAFDKVAKMLELGYPGGPIISQLAKLGKAKYQLPIPMLDSKDLNFSFSGLKTACLYFLQKIPARQKTRQFIQDFAASFETAVAKTLTNKLEKAIVNFNPKQIVLGGGVINNLKIRQLVRQTGRKYHLPVHLPYSPKLLTDNAAMVGVCAWYQAKRKDLVKNIAGLDRQPNLNFN